MNSNSPTSVDIIEQQSVFNISASIFHRFIGIPTTIKVCSRGVVIDVENNSTNISWQDLTVPPSFHLSFFGQIISFKTEKRNYVYSMLAYSAKRKYKNMCEQLWASANIHRVESLLTAIENFTTNRYLRQSTLERIQLASKQELVRWLPWLNANRSSNAAKSLANISIIVQRLSYYQIWNEQEIADSRESYIAEQLQIHKSFFDQVESDPLTQCQRRACIIDNDNNLLLAGAGTGKTSVMVGRTGYLLKSLQGKSEEILLLAYGRKAASEMDDRIREKLSTDRISATTFHSLGLSIIAQVEGKKPKISAFAEDEKAKLAWIQGYFDTLINDSAHYRELVVDYLTNYEYIERSAFDFKSLGESYQYFNDNDIRSFKGEQVRNFGQLYIANALFSHGIAYQYQAKYGYDVQTTAGKQYQPDFFLPELNVYIDYHEIDHNGNTATYIDDDTYLQRIEWQRAAHENYNTDCIELNYAQQQEGKLISTLMQLLMERKTPVQAPSNELFSTEPIPTEFMTDTLKENGKITTLATLMCQLVGLYKAACLEISLGNTSNRRFNNAKHEEVIAASLAPKQTTRAFTLLNPILTAYEQHLSNSGEIDFEDMINKALSYVKTDKFKSPWRYIMVDEFQDISEPRARLVKALRDNKKECSIFAVGDDWQAIYRFSGADVSLTTQFARYFGATTQSALMQTFRFNNQIAKVATDFISKNPAQISKSISSIKQVDAPAVSLLKRESSQNNMAKTMSNKTMIIDEMANGAIDEVLTAISAKVCKPITVYLLARFWFLLPTSIDIKRLNNQYPLLAIEGQSFHASKGKEADYVIIIGMKKGIHGFPSAKTTPAIHEALLAKEESFKYAEERRLFYVALTRAKDRAYIIADMSDSNNFVQELVNDHHIELNEFDSTTSQSSVADLPCMVCDTGLLKKRTGRFGTFYACSNSPRCQHKEKPCANCDSPMTRKRYPGFKTCLNQPCKNIVPTCVQCNAEMVLRKSNKGEFWGCQNYRGNDPMSCKNSVDNANINWPELITEYP
ncbi:UvrD-helicase domain-containing protein [Colwellia psychrerythraea]|uniref:DNA 3'-5' helicase n=1 Tax=Colwellia psychrerythraea TaxID=28229 RepID=A0A099KKR9_COLPS|nr:UvrD-helicase domain-containing protein [Colwellia psychrerythraea]KGJ90158.1 Helicase superfamily 1 UvrD-related protein [Colwellia psychrerythraea]